MVAEIIHKAMSEKDVYTTIRPRIRLYVPHSAVHVAQIADDLLEEYRSKQLTLSDSLKIKEHQIQGNLGHDTLHYGMEQSMQNETTSIRMRSRSIVD